MKETPRVRILDEVACPPPRQTSVPILCCVGGRVQVVHQQVQRPDYFERVLTTVAEKRSSAPETPRLRLGGVRDMARAAYRRLVVARAEYGPSRRFDRPVLDYRRISAGNIAHLLTEIIPVVLHARRSVGPDMATVLSPLGRNATPNFLKLLNVFGINPIFTNLDIEGPIVAVKPVRGLSAFEIPPLQYPSISLFPGTYAGWHLDSRKSYEKIFISRRGTRSLENSHEVELYLEQRGYKTIFMEDYSVADQLSIGANARHVVTLHSAAMGVLLLAPYIETLVEIFPPHVYHEFYPIALQEVVKRHVCMVPDFDPDFGYGDFSTTLFFKSRTFRVNVDLVDQALSLIDNK